MFNWRFARLCSCFPVFFLDVSQGLPDRRQFRKFETGVSFFVPFKEPIFGSGQLRALFDLSRANLREHLSAELHPLTPVDFLLFEFDELRTYFESYFQHTGRH